MLTHLLDHTARKPKVRFEAMAVRKPVQLKVSSPADAMPTPTCQQEVRWQQQCSRSVYVQALRCRALVQAVHEAAEAKKTSLD